MTAPEPTPSPAANAAVFRISAEVRSALRADAYPAVPNNPDYLTDEEFGHFLAICEQRRMNPVMRHIYATKRYDKRLGRKKMSVEATIDGLRLTADRTGRYRGQTDARWADAHGAWHDVWLKDGYPSAAKAGVWRTGDVEPITAVAHWDEFAQKTNSGALTPMWRDKPRLMIAKCAEALALRKAFPEELGGLYTAEELNRSDSDAVTPTVATPPTVPAGGVDVIGACVQAGYSPQAAQLLGALAGAGAPGDQLADGPAAQAAAWANALAGAGIPEQTVIDCVTYAITNSPDWTEARRRFAAWLAAKQQTAKTAPAGLALTPVINGR